MTYSGFCLLLLFVCPAILLGLSVFLLVASTKSFTSYVLISYVS